MHKLIYLETILIVNALYIFISNILKKDNVYKKLFKAALKRNENCLPIGHFWRLNSYTPTFTMFDNVRVCGSAKANEYYNTLDQHTVAVFHILILDCGIGMLRLWQSMAIGMAIKQYRFASIDSQITLTLYTRVHCFVK